MPLTNTSFTTTSYREVPRGGELPKEDYPEVMAHALLRTLA